MPTVWGMHVACMCYAKHVQTAMACATVGMCSCHIWSKLACVIAHTIVTIAPDIYFWNCMFSPMPHFCIDTIQTLYFEWNCFVFWRRFILCDFVLFFGDAVLWVFNFFEFGPLFNLSSLFILSFRYKTIYFLYLYTYIVCLLSILCSCFFGYLRVLV